MKRQLPDPCPPIRLDDRNPFWSIFVAMAIATIVLFATFCRAADPVPSHISDIQGWPRNGLPIGSNWNTGGFVPDWHAQQVVDGHHVIVTVKLPVTVAPGQFIPMFTAAHEKFVRDNRLILCARTDNVGSMVAGLPRVALSIDELPRSAVRWRKVGDGYDDDSTNDCFADPEIWRQLGKTWASMAPAKSLHKRFPDASKIIIADNGEENEDKVAAYCLYQAVPPYRFSRQVAWKPDLPSLSVRVADYAATHTAAQFQKDFYDLVNSQYHALWDGFESVTPSWQGRILTEAYAAQSIGWNPSTPYPPDDFYSGQYSPDFGRYDGGGTGIYSKYPGDPAKGAYWDMTSLWHWFRLYYADLIASRAEQLNPNHFRELILSASDAALIAGWKNGRHEVMTPERCQAWYEWMLWSIKGVGKGVHLRYWIGNAVKPTDKFVSAAYAPDFVAAGHPELIDSTFDAWIQPIFRANDHICEDPILRDFFQRGKCVCTGVNPGNECLYSPAVQAIPQGEDQGWRLLDCNLNTPRSEWVLPPTKTTHGDINRAARIQVWGTAIELEGRYLVHLWSPCKLDGTCKITIPMHDGNQTFEVAVPQPAAYFVVWDGKVYSLDDYKAATARTDVDDWWDEAGQNLKLDPPLSKEEARRLIEILKSWLSRPVPAMKPQASRTPASCRILAV